MTRSKAAERYGIAEWYGLPLVTLHPNERAQFARHALRRMGEETPICPFQENAPRCSKKGGVCSIQKYRDDGEGYLGTPIGDPVITCPRRFEESALVVRWLARIAEFPESRVSVAREVPFMVRDDGRHAGKVDLVVAYDARSGNAVARVGNPGGVFLR